MDNFSQEEIRRTVHVLQDLLDISSREDFERKDDAGSDLRDLEGIGEVRAPIVAALHTISEEEWIRVTGLPLHEGFDVRDSEGNEDDDPDVILAPPDQEQQDIMFVGEGGAPLTPPGQEAQEEV